MSLGIIRKFLAETCLPSGLKALEKIKIPNRITQFFGEAVATQAEKIIVKPNTVDFSTKKVKPLISKNYKTTDSLKTDSLFKPISLTVAIATAIIVKTKELNVEDCLKVEKLFKPQIAKSIVNTLDMMKLYDRQGAVITRHVLEEHFDESDSGFALKPNQSASYALNALIKAPSSLSKTAAMKIVYFKAILDAIGAAKFDVIFSKLSINDKPIEESPVLEYFVKYPGYMSNTIGDINEFYIESPTSSEELHLFYVDNDEKNNDKLFSSLAQSQISEHEIDKLDHLRSRRAKYSLDTYFISAIFLTDEKHVLSLFDKQQAYSVQARMLNEFETSPMFWPFNKTSL